MSKHPPVVPAPLDWFVLILLTAVWGASFYFIKHAVRIFTPMQTAMWRMVLALVIYLPVAALYWSKIDWKRWKPLAVVAFFGSAIPNFLFSLAQQHVTSSLAGVLNSLTPLFTLLMGAAFFQMHFGKEKILGVLLGFAGAVTLILFNRSSAVEGNGYFAALCVCATLCYAVNANTVNRHLRDQHPAGIASAAFVLTGVFFLIGLWACDGVRAAQQHPEGWRGLGYILYLAAVGTVGGSILYYWLLQRTSAIFATSVTYLLPVSALLLGAFDGEAIGVMDLVGTGIILVGVYLVRQEHSRPAKDH